MSQKAMLIILDGWGIGEIPEVDAIACADTSNFDSLKNRYPHSTLTTFGERVGLPHGQMGNSEVGHLNIGAGRVVYQDLLRINNAIQDGSFFQLDALHNAVDYASRYGKNIHLIGLVSDGGVHSQIGHLKALVDYFDKKSHNEVYIHAFLDGRDTSPTGGKDYIADLLTHLDGKKAHLASMIGRYYAMDRDNRWERIELAYNLLVNGIGTESKDAIDHLDMSYDAEEYDEFIQPVILPDFQKISEGDVVLFFNFRTDRPRQLTTALTGQSKVPFETRTLELNFLTMTVYDEEFTGITSLYGKQKLHNTLGAYLATCNKTQLRIAETEKYAHVTFFFNGGEEEPNVGESRVLCPSPPVATYDLQPEMSADCVQEKVIQFAKTEYPDFICLNFANPDMVGHTGDLKAAIKAVEAVDKALGKIVRELQVLGYEFLIIADHGNADIMKNPNGSPHTAHTTNPVPIIYVGDQGQLEKDGALSDIAPTILRMMSLEIPQEMTGRVLISDES